MFVLVITELILYDVMNIYLLGKACAAPEKVKQDTLISHIKFVKWEIVLSIVLAKSIERYYFEQSETSLYLNYEHPKLLNPMFLVSVKRLYSE